MRAADPPAEPAEPPATPRSPRRTGSGTSGRVAGAARRTLTEASAAAKAGYDARPKVLWKDVDPALEAKLRAIYRHQLRHGEGVEGWSEFGRTVVLTQFIEAYEERHGEIPVDDAPVRLKPGTRVR